MRHDQINSKLENKFLSCSLGPVQKGTCGLRCWFLPDSPISVDNINMLFSFDTTRPEQLDECITVVKSDRRTRVIRFQANGIPFIAKIFSMHRFKDSLRHRRYAFSELKNNIIARQRGINTPKCYTYFEKRFCGLVQQCGVIMETLVGYTELTHLMRSGKRTLFDAIPILKKLYCRGVNHIDMSPKNIFLRECDNHCVIIDWQYCSFYPPGNDLQLCLMAATFLLYNSVKSGDLMWHPWLKNLFEQCRPEITYDKMQKAVHVMQNRKIHWKVRLSLDVSGLGVDTIW